MQLRPDAGAAGQLNFRSNVRQFAERSRFSVAPPYGGFWEEVYEGKANIIFHFLPRFGNNVGLHAQEPGTIQLLVLSVVNDAHIDNGVFVVIQPFLYVDPNDVDVAELGLERDLGDLAYLLPIQIGPPTAAAA